MHNRQVAVKDARWICKERYGRAPRVEVEGDDLTMAIIPENLYYICLVRTHALTCLRTFD